MKYTNHTLKKIEALFEELAYTVRYERGNFQSGYCIVQNSSVIVINKYYDTEGRINCLLDILQEIEVNAEGLEEKSAKFLKQLQKHIFSLTDKEDSTN